MQLYCVVRADCRKAGSMFLDNLNQEEKVVFLELAYKVAYANRELSEEEISQMKEYRRICGVSSIQNTGTVDQLMAYFADKNETVRRTVFFELYTILYSNDKITITDEEIIAKAHEHFNLDEDVFREIASAAQDLRKVEVRLRKLVNG